MAASVKLRTGKKRFFLALLLSGSCTKERLNSPLKSNIITCENIASAITFFLAEPKGNKPYWDGKKFLFFFPYACKSLGFSFFCETENQVAEELLFGKQIDTGQVELRSKNKVN